LSLLQREKVYRAPPPPRWEMGLLPGFVVRLVVFLPALQPASWDIEWRGAYPTA